MLQADSLRIIGQYELLEVLGQGGVSIVYKAYDQINRREVALKLLHGRYTLRSDLQRNFLEEGRAVAALSHPNIIQVYEVAERDGLLYIVMENIAGNNLRDRLNAFTSANQFMDLAEVAAIGQQIGYALHYAHMHNIIHRDVKPDNVLIRYPQTDYRGLAIPEVADTMQYVLTDFGMARRVNGDASVAENRELLGTLAYMAPEQFRALPLDARYDVYSLGVMLYELIAGHQPFWSTSVIDLILMHTQGEPEQLQDIRPDTPPALVSIIHRAMMKNREDRYESALAMARELEAIELTLRGAKPKFVPRHQQRSAVTNAGGVNTTFDVLPAVDAPAIPVNLFSNHDNDTIIITPQLEESESWSISLTADALTVGRDVGCTIVLPDSRVSRQHMLIGRMPDGRLTITDTNSTNGIYLNDMRLAKDVVAAWSDHESVKIGPYWLTLHLSQMPIAVGRRAETAQRRQTVHNVDDSLGVVIDPSEAITQPGGAAVIKLTFTNKSDYAMNLDIALGDLPQEWFTTIPVPIFVQPQSTAERMITLHPPRLPSSIAQAYPYTLKVIIANSMRPILTIPSLLHVYPYYEYQSDVKLHDKELKVQLINRGNSARSYVLEVQEPNNALNILPARTRVVLEPNQMNEQIIHLQPKSFHQIGQPKIYPLKLYIRTDGMPLQVHSLNFKAQPLMTWWMVGLMIIVMINILLLLLMR